MGTNYIAPTWRVPRNANKDKLSNYSINFTGNEYITCDVITQLGNKTQATWSGWFNRSNTASYYIMSSWGTSGTDRQFLVLQTPTRLAVWMGLGQYGNQRPMFDSSSLTFTTGVWYHLMFVYNESEASNADKMKVYINNVVQTNEIAGSAINFINPVTSPFIIGTIGGYLTNEFQGQISQVSIFDYALSADQRSYLYNLNNPMAISGAEPVAYWPLGDNSNPIATAGYPNISVGADSVFDFDSSGPDYITTPGIDIGKTNTLSFWIKRTAVGNQVVLNNNHNNAWYNYIVRLVSNGDILYATNANGASTTFNNANTRTLVNALNVWINIVIVRTEQNVVCYVNNQNNDGTKTLTNNNWDTVIDNIGVAGDNSSFPFDGELSNIQLWNTDLSSSEVETLYNNGQPLMTGTQPQENNLKAWYKLNQTANWEADTAGNWQIPDAVSSYPQSFDFVPNEIITTPNVFSDIVTGSNKIGICTISYWLKVSGGSLMSFMQLVGSSTAYTAGFRIDSNNKPYYINSSGSRYKRFTALSNPSDWNHWCWIFPSDTSYADLKLYINGVEKSVDFDFSAAPANNAWDGFYINKYQNSSTATFKMSNLQLWSGNLTEPQITELYNNGVPLTTAIASENLKAWYKLDNTELFDGNNWSVNNQKYPANYTSALHFTGSVGNEHLETNSNSDLLMAGSHTFSLWLNISTPGSDSTNYIFDKGGLDYSLGFSANALRLIYYNYYDSGGASGNNKIVVLDSDWKTTYQNGWHHIFVSVDQPNLTVTLITDGTDISTHALPSDYVSPDQGAGKLNIMSYNGVTLSLAGFISNLAFFNGTALTNSQALTLYNSGTPENSISFSPTSWWKINNTSTGLLDNAGTANLTNTGGVEKNIFVSAEAGQSSGMTEQNLVNNNVSSLNGESSGMNTTNLVQSDLTRKKPFSNYSVKFDGTDYFTDTGGGFLNGATTASISVWMMLNTIPGTYSPVVSAWGSDRQYLIRHDINSANGFQFYIGGNFVVGGSAANFVLAETQASIPLVVDNWYNVIGTFDGTTAKIYVNGVLGGSGSTTSGTLNSTTSPNQIGRFSTTNINGYVSNTAFWVNTVLNQDDILNIYNNGVSQDLSNFKITPTNWFPLDQSYIYYNGSVIVARDAISGSELDGVNLIQENIVGNAPGSEANGVGNNLTIADLKVNMYNSDKNAYSINMGDYADGITNPANSGRSTNTP